MIPWFSVYCALGILKLGLFAVMTDYWWYIPLDSVVLVVLMIAVREAFLWFIFELSPESERRALISGLFGFGLASGSMFIHIGDTGAMGWFTTARSVLHAGLFGFLFVAILYAAFAKPYPVERSMAWHAILLTGWLAAHAISGPLGHYSNIQTALVFTPIAIALYLGWNALLLLKPPEILKPQFYFGTLPTPRVADGAKEGGSQLRPPSHLDSGEPEN